MSSRISTPQTTMLSTYSYDKLNRLKQDQPYTMVNNASTVTSKWSSSYSYDLDGNITNLMRDDGNGGGIDNLSYAYPASGGKTINNRLNHIVDHTTGNGGDAGVVTQNPGNYSYDATGNLTADVTEGITSITWTPYNKIRELVKTNASPATGTTTLRYLYAAAGNRVVKDYHATQNTTLTSRTWYIRDAQGTVLAIYTRKPTVGNSGSVTRTEAPIYGSSRIGQSTRTATYDATASGEATLLGTVYSRELGKRAYELVDHLGNVRATISDILVPRTATNTYDADILTLTDYYPFGMQMDIRTWEASGVAGHRYGYNGKENDDEVKGQGNQQDYGFRIYDPRVARFLSVDPLAPDYPGLTTYQFSSNRPIDGVDLDGLEFLSADEAMIDIKLGVPKTKIQAPIFAVSEDKRPRIVPAYAVTFRIENTPGPLYSAIRDSYFADKGLMQGPSGEPIPDPEYPEPYPYSVHFYEREAERWHRAKEEYRQKKIKDSPSTITVGKSLNNSKYGAMAGLPDAAAPFISTFMNVAIADMMRQIRFSVDALTIVENASRDTGSGMSSYYRTDANGKAILANYILSGALPEGKHWGKSDLSYLRKLGDSLYERRNEYLPIDRQDSSND